MLVSAREVSRFLAVNVTTVYRLVKRGELPAYRISNDVVRFDMDEVKTWLRERRTA